METKEKTLQDLSYNLVLKICQDVGELSDQVSLAKTCGCICEMFVNRVWKQRERFRLIGPTHLLACHERTVRDYAFFVKKMRKHFTKFTTINERHCPKGLTEYLRMLKSFNLCKFPGVTMCVIETPEVAMVDADMLQLSKMLPNVRFMLLSYQWITGCHIEKFLKLEELCLINVYPKLCYLQEILRSNVHLHTLDIRNTDELSMSGISSTNLEVLRLDAHSAVKIATEILALTKLKVLEVRCSKSIDEDSPEELKRLHQLFDHVFAQKCDKMLSIVMDNGALNLPENWDKRLLMKTTEHLQTLSINGWPYESLFLDRQLNNRTKLRVLALGDWEQLTPSNLMMILAKLKDLQMLQLPYMHLNNKMLKHIVNILQYMNRTECLHICSRFLIKHSLLTKQQVAYWRKHELVQLVSPDNSSKDVAVCQREIWGFEFTFENNI